MERNMERLAQSLCSKLRLRKVQGAKHVAVETALLYKQIIAVGEWQTAQSMIDAVKAVGRALTAAQPRGSYHLLLMKN